MSIWNLIICMMCLLSFSDLISKENKQVVLITGCSRGIGLSTAQLLAKNDYTVYATVRNDMEKDSPWENLHYKKLDVTNSQSIHEVVRDIIEKEGQIDVLINNAGFALAGPLECLSVDEIKEQMNVNFYGVIRMIQSVLPQMRKQRNGHIINISSEIGLYGLPYGSLYTSSKAAIESLSEAISIELMPWNINVSIVEPGTTATKFTVKLGSRDVESKPYEKINNIISQMIEKERVVSEVCQSKEDVAEAIVQIVKDPCPKLRYQTSQIVKETVSNVIRDLDGEKYKKWMKSQVREFYNEAWSNP